MRVPLRTWVVAVAWACGVAAIGCGRDQGGQPQPQPEPTETTATASAPLNADPQSPSFAIEARWSLVLRDHVDVQRGDIGTRESNAAAMLVPGFEVALLDHASVGTTQSILGDSVQLGPKAIVGDVQTNALSDLGAKHGVVAPFTPLPELPALRQVQPGSSPLIINAHSTVDVTAGAWSTLTVKDHAKVRLAAGLYQVGDLVMQEQSRLEATGAVEIRVAGRLDVAAHAFIGAAPGAQLTAQDLRIQVVGMNGAHGGLNETPKSARFAEHDEVHALVLAPNGTLVVGAHGLLFGALAAREVDLGEHTKLTWEEGFPSEGCGGGCDDGNACTVDACAGGSCTHEAAADGTACDDGNACTQADVCAAGACVGANPVECAAIDACHLAGTCEPATGVCSAPSAPAGAACSDGNACNGVETCDGSGSCVAGAPPTVDDGNPCTVDACDPAVGVTHALEPAGSRCSDDNVCNGAEVCDGAGVCTTGAPLVADDGNPCTDDSCEPGVGVVHAPKKQGVICWDSNLCHLPSVCDGAGHCPMPNMEMGSRCGSVDGCAYGGTCDNQGNCLGANNAAVGTPCEDPLSSGCSTGGTCDGAGKCEGLVPAAVGVACQSTFPCMETDGTCDGSGRCVTQMLPAGSACSDFNACNGEEICADDGRCLPGGSPPPSVDDGNPCTTDTCTVISGQILHVPVDTDDGNACTADVCNRTTGEITHAVLPSGASCDDGTPCHDVGQCSPNGICVAPNLAPGTACDDPRHCRVGGICDASGTCTGLHQASEGRSCPAASDCLWGSCNSAGMCIVRAKSAFIGCQSQGSCFTDSTCDGTGLCTGGALWPADDENPCTVEACDENGNTTHTPMAAGSACSTGNPCLGQGMCDANTQCVAGAPVAAGSRCDDGDSCTSGESCDGAGTCAGGVSNLDDGNPCTIDACSAYEGPQHYPAAVGTACGDGDVCNGEETCDGNGACVAGVAVVVDDENPCTVDACDALAGVTHVAAVPGSWCADDNACNGDETCDGSGHCAAGKAPIVDDGNPCTVDACDPALGPVHTAVAVIDDGNPCTLEVCDPILGLHPPAVSGVVCADGNPCNGVETCNGNGACTAGSPPTIDDGNPCTFDHCDAIYGISHESRAGRPCSDGDVCNGEEICDSTDHCQRGVPPVVDDGNPCTVDSCIPSFGVVHGYQPAGTACNDGNACTQVDKCQSGQCVGTSPIQCGAQDQCHSVGTCDPATGVCTNPLRADDTPCDDGDRCTTADTCQAGVCAGRSVQCPAPDECQLEGACVPSTGKCSYPTKPDGTACGLSSPCVHGGACSFGACIGGTPVAVDDGDPCTLDICDPVDGVQHHACSPLDRAVATSVATSTKFLYEGPAPIQVGVAPGTIAPTRASVVRGTVKDRAGVAMPGVTISILGHPELGTTVTQGDGHFDMAVNGGGILTIMYARTGFLDARRTLDVSWGASPVAPEVVLIQRDVAATDVQLGTEDAYQVAAATPVLDDSGPRQAVLLFPPNVQATAVLPDASTVTLPAVRVRATEYTVDSSGPLAMPAELPTNTAYTYAVDFSADEAESAGAVSLQFDRPVVSYTNNFLHFHVGTPVPSGYFDKAKNAWVGAPDGRVIAIVGVIDGAAELDTDGDGVADDASALAALGITDAERALLASMYDVSTSFWRVPITHFSAWDFNWPFGPPPNAGPPPGDPSSGDGGSGGTGGSGGNGGSGGAGNDGAGGDDQGTDDPCNDSQAGKSVIECQNQVLREDVPITGTPFRLVYSSERIIGRTAANTVTIPLTGSTLPAAPPERVEVEVEVAGRRFDQTFGVAPNEQMMFTWDGNDTYGRAMQGTQGLTARVGFVYHGVYLAPSERPESGTEYDSLFGHFSYYGMPATGDRTRQEVTLWTTMHRTVGHWDAEALGFGGWSVSVQHAYDPQRQIIYFGDGRRKHAAQMPSIITTVAGNGEAPLGYGGHLPNVDEIPAISASIYAGAPLIGPDGSIFFGDGSSVRRVRPDGIITTTADLPHGAPGALALDRLGRLLITQGRGGLFRVGEDGQIHQIAGGSPTASYDDPVYGLPATDVALSADAVVVAPDGTIYIGDCWRHRIHRLQDDGTLAPAAGTGSGYYPGSNNGDGGRAVDAALVCPSELAIAPDGKLYFHDRDVIRVVRPDGIVDRVAGGGSHQEDGAAAAEALLPVVGALAVAPNGELYFEQDIISNVENNTWFIAPRVRKIDLTGHVFTIAGLAETLTPEMPSTMCKLAGDGLAAAGAQLCGTNGIAFDSAGRLYIAENNRVRRVEPPLPGTTYVGDIAVASDDGSEVYVFAADGLHRKTLDALTGVVRYEFTYDSAARLVSVTDGDGNVTTIARGTDGQPKAITSPDGNVTSLAVDADGYLASIADPAGHAYSMSYAPGGLLQTMTDPNGATSTKTYDALGRLQSDADAVGGTDVLSRTELASGWQTTKTTSLGKATTYTTTNALGGQNFANVFPDGTSASTVTGADGTRTARAPDGTVVVSTPSADPRFGLQSPSWSVTTSTPAGLVRAVTSAQTVQFATANDPLSLLSLTDRTTVNGNAWTTVFDAGARMRTTTSPTGRRTFVSLDAKGHLASSQLDGLIETVLSYDGRGRLGSVVQGERAQTFDYGPDGFLASATDPLAQTTTFVRDAAGHVTAEVLPDGSVVQFGYDANGNLTSLAPPGRPAHQFSYDPRGLVTKYMPPVVPGSGMNETSYTYDLDRNLTDVLRPDGGNVHLDYDAAGRASTVTLPTGETIALGYDPTSGKLTGATGPSVGQALAYGYDGFLLTDTTWSGQVNGSVHRTYDNFFRLATESVNGANAVTYGYDADGLVTSVGAMTLAPSPVNGLLTGTTLGGVTDAYTYDAYGQVASYTAKFGSAVLYAYSIDERDALGRIKQKTETIQGTTHVYQYGYSSRGWLTDVSTDGQVTGHYEYDANGNRTSLTQNGVTQSAYFDDQDRLLAQGTLQFTYTPNGEVRTKTDTATGEVTTYAYDALGNLVRVELPDGRVIEYVIDAMGRRVGKKVNEVLVKRWLWGGHLSVVAELDGAGFVISRLVGATRVNTPEYASVGEVTYRIIADYVGSPRLVVDTSSGTIVQKVDRDEYGRLWFESSPGRDIIGFAGGLLDVDAALIHFGKREYDPDVGRWMSKDPLNFGAEQGNLYTYVACDPINLRDPDGTKIEAANLAAQAALQQLWTNPSLKPYLDQLAESNDFTIDIYPVDDAHCGTGGGKWSCDAPERVECYVRYDVRCLSDTFKAKQCDGDLKEALAHELGHAWAEKFGYEKYSDQWALDFENAARGASPWRIKH